MTLLLASFGISLASALIPLINIEAYVIGISSSGVGSAAAVTLSVVCGAGQSAGKVVWYEATRRGFESGWVQKKLSNPKIRASYERWVERMEGRPWYGGAILFAAAFVGLPPLLVMAAVAGALKMPMWVFLPTIFVGRTLRFWICFEFGALIEWGQILEWLVFWT